MGALGESQEQRTRPGLSNAFWRTSRTSGARQTKRRQPTSQAEDGYWAGRAAFLYVLAGGKNLSA